MEDYDIIEIKTEEEELTIMDEFELASEEDSFESNTEFVLVGSDDLDFKTKTEDDPTQYSGELENVSKNLVTSIKTNCAPWTENGNGDHTYQLPGLFKCKKSELNLDSDSKFSWTRKATFVFLDLYEERFEAFRNPKIKKKTLWNEIRLGMKSQGYLVNCNNLDRKMRNMKGTFKSIIDNKIKTGRGRIQWEYYNRFRQMFAGDKPIGVAKPPSNVATVPSMQSSNSSVPSMPSSNSSVPSMPSSNSSVPSMPSSNSSVSSMRLSNSPVPPSNVPTVPPSNAPAKAPKVSTPSLPSVTQLEVEESSALLNTPAPLPSTQNGNKGSKRLHVFGERRLDIEERKLVEVRKIREAIEENNRLNREKLELFKEFLKTRSQK